MSKGFSYSTFETLPTVIVYGVKTYKFNEDENNVNRRDPNYRNLDVETSKINIGILFKEFQLIQQDPHVRKNPEN